MSAGLSPTQIRRLRENFERGLLAVILNENRAAGLTQMSEVTQALVGHCNAGADWHLLQRWLVAVEQQQLALSSFCFVVFREVSKALKALDQRDQGATGTQGWQLPALEAVRDGLIQALAPLTLPQSSQLSGQTDQWSALRQSLQKVLDRCQHQSDVRGWDFSALGAQFVQLQQFASGLGWADVLEICGALLNLVDRLVDGTVLPGQQHGEVFADANALLATLTPPESNSSDEGLSHIDDSAYERVIERADVLASGGEFQLSSADKESSALATQQLAALLDALPGLLESLREGPQGRLQEDGLAPQLDQDLAQLAVLAERLQGRLG
ncbi:MAG: hypothetical protein GWP70_10480 [Proteobacteria bacterium]|nr:hypothetical protein [Pseudomonadota bacterium]